MSVIYTPADWHWIVGSDESRYWSSAAAAYVNKLPEDAPATCIASEEELSGVLAAYGLPGPAELVPVSVTPAQAKIALYEAGLLDDVEALVLNYPYRPVSIWWTSALAFERGHPYLNAIGIELDLTDDQIDVLFVAAAKK